MTPEEVLEVIDTFGTGHLPVEIVYDHLWLPLEDDCGYMQTPEKYLQVKYIVPPPYPHQEYPSTMLQSRLEDNTKESVTRWINMSIYCVILHETAEQIRCNDVVLYDPHGEGMEWCIFDPDIIRERVNP